MVHLRVSAAAAAVLTDIYYDIEAYEKITQYLKVNELRTSMIIKLDTVAPKTGSIIGGVFNVDIMLLWKFCSGGRAPWLSSPLGIIILVILTLRV